jgi:c-di-GMP-binding flagellar brake protein YcgR
MDRRELYNLSGSVVRVTDPADGAAYLFSVDAAANSNAVLRPCSTESKDFAAELAAGTALAVVAQTLDGVLRGSATVVRWSPAERVLVVDNPPLEFTQRRSAYRVPAQVDVEVLVTDVTAPAGVRLVRGRSTDLSLTGCSFTLPGEDLPVGTETFLVLRAERTPLLFVIEVCGRRADSRHAHRCRFVQIHPYEQTALAAEVRRLEVAKAAPVRGPRALR